MVVAAPDSIRRTVGLIVTEGTLTHEASGRVAADIHVYGVDDAFWAFHDRPAVVLGSTGAALSPALATALGAREGDTLLLRARAAGGVPLATLPGRRDPALARIPVTMARTLAASAMGEFSLVQDQRPVMAVFVPLPLLRASCRWPDASTRSSCSTRHATGLGIRCARHRGRATAWLRPPHCPITACASGGCPATA